jgi:hypothetical protein
MNKSITFAAILICLIGMGFIAWACAQMMMIVPYYSHWGDVAGLLIGVCLNGAGYIMLIDLGSRPSLA